MAEQTPQEASPEQLIYANLLEKGMLIGLGLLLVTFGIYALGIMKPYIPVNELPRYWSHNVTEYLHMAGIHSGWSWLGMLGYGDFINFIGIVILAGVTVFCYLAIIPVLLRKKDRVYTTLAFLEVLVLVLAASGLLGGGGH